MNRALHKEMKEMRKGILSEKDPVAKALMASMYKDMYGQAFRTEDAERPMMLMRRFIRSTLFYLILALAAIAALGAEFGKDVVYVGGFLIFGIIIAFAVLSLRTTDSISQDSMERILNGVFAAIAPKNSRAPGKDALPSSDRKSPALGQKELEGQLDTISDLELPPGT
jgi:hypothetical protein